MRAAPPERPMAVWRLPNGREVGRVSQGVALDGSGRPAAVYFAQAQGLPKEPCPRFACAKTKVETALMALGLPATGVLL